ncbi:peptidase M24, structural domain-containing protein [Phyllosticta capitalensis]|uniref:Xaa-Pro aminopeptidase n=1 Tax=Phyllosticta capitalensis TaxID=121624 RepID=A0ABR1YM10_9PEZI
MASLSNAMSTLRINVESPISLDKYPAKQHAKRVASILGVDKGLIYLPGAPTTYLEDSDQTIPFRQRRFFYYLSGVDEADCHLIYDIGYDLLALYVPRVSPKEVIWNGRGSNPAEALDKYDVDHVDYADVVVQHVDSWLDHCKDGEVYILHPDQGTRKDFDKSPRVNSTDLKKAMDVARLRKDPHEIKLIRRANNISAKAHTNVLKNIAQFSNEAQVEAIFLDTCVAEDAKHQAYEIIAASGGNAATLHYVENNQDFGSRELMCLDAGAEWDCYASDVTRTFPLKGDWPSKEAKDIYNLVQSMQTACINAIKPGVRFIDLQNLAHRVAIWGLLKLGILHHGNLEEIFQAKTSMAFFPHGLGHHVGLDVHDIINLPMTPCGRKSLNTDLCGPNPNPPPFHPMSCGLEEGMVVTIEPGIYFSAFALRTLYLPNPVHAKYINMTVVERYFPVGGVRIEDDILVTDNGHENLTTAPKGEEALKIIQDSIKHHANTNDTPRRPQNNGTVPEAISSLRDQIRDIYSIEPGSMYSFPPGTDLRPSSARDAPPSRPERPIARDALRALNSRSLRYDRPRSGPMRPNKLRDGVVPASHQGASAEKQGAPARHCPVPSTLPQPSQQLHADVIAAKEVERQALLRLNEAREAERAAWRQLQAFAPPFAKPPRGAARPERMDLARKFMTLPKRQKDQVQEVVKEETPNEAASSHQALQGPNPIDVQKDKEEAELQEQDVARHFDANGNEVKMDPYSAWWLEYINNGSVAKWPPPKGLVVDLSRLPGLDAYKQK